MKLLYVTAMLPHGPGEAFLIPELAELLARGHELVLVPTYPRGPVLHEDAKALLPATVALAPVSLRILGAAALELGGSFRKVLPVLTDVLHSRNPRILVKNLLVFPKGLWLARCARRRGIDHIHAHWAGTSSTVALVASEVSGVPWSFTVHRWDIAEDNLLRVKAAKACFVRSISRRGARQLERFMPEGERTALVRVGVEAPSSDHSPLPRAQSDRPFAVLVAANMVPVKGHTYLLQALRLVLDRGCAVRLAVAGDGPLLPDLRREVSDLGLDDRVELLGRVSHEWLVAEMGAGRWDAAALASIRTDDGAEEGVPVFLIEAMGLGLPVVATDTGAIPELVCDGAGLLVPERDAAALAAALERLVRTPELRRTLARRGRERVRSEFVVDAIATDLLQRFGGCAADASNGTDRRP